MNHVDRADHLRSSYDTNSQFRRLRQGWKALFWRLFNMMLVNSYLLSLHSDPELNNPRFTNQNQFRTQLHRDLFQLANKHSTKRRHREYILSPNITESAHPSIFRNILEECHGCKLKKRRILGEVSGNSAPSRPRCTKYGFSTCDAPLCREGDCFDVFYRQIV